MKSRRCGLGQRIGAVDSPTPHADPSGGQAPALHFLIPPSTMGLQFGTFRRWRAGIEVDWRAHPGSESGTCFRTNRSCRLAPAQQGMTMRPASRKCLGVVGATLPLWIPAFAGMTNSAAGTIHVRTNRSCRLAPGQQGMTMRPASRKCLGVVGATLPLWIPVFAGMTNGGPD